MEFKTGQLTLAYLKKLYTQHEKIILNNHDEQRVNAAYQIINQVITEGKHVYGVNTGFGKLANKTIEADALSQLQTSLILSHATGVGDLLDNKIVRLILCLKINSLARGHSGVRWQVIENLVTLFNAEVYPCIPSKGSVGASGDLAPLAHMSLVLLGEGEVFFQDKFISAKEALNKLNLSPLTLGPKEGLALINGTQVSTAIALGAFFETENIFNHAITIGALCVEAVKGSHQPFDARIHEIRGQDGQCEVARRLRELLADSEIERSHENCDRVQDPYSLRCQPQVMGACLDQLNFSGTILEKEANAVSDNPLIFCNNNSILSGGNFHAEPVAMAADVLALVLAEIGALSERRIALLIDKHLSGLPSFLVDNAGVNSGFMIAHVTAAALASENKSLAHPASVDSLPTSANQEDHVSMATFAARRLYQMADNTLTIISIEYLAACQGIDFHRPLKTSKKLQEAHDLLRQHVGFYKQDRFFAPDIKKARKILQF